MTVSLVSDDSRLWGGAEPLNELYGTALLDLDGVVYLLGEPIDGAREAVQRLRNADCVPVFVTNNASRRAADVAKLLTSRGIDACAEEVRTSAQTAAQLLKERCAPESAILVVGAEALVAEVAEVGLTPVDSAREIAVTAVVQGYGPDTGWRELADAVMAVRAGAWWVASNTDATMPSPMGPLPGNGTLVAVVATALGRQPDAVAGKPAPEMLRRAVSDHPGRSALMVGDRWDTDIAGARAAGLPGMLVLSGSASPRDVLGIPADARPRYLAWTVAGVNEPHPVVDVAQTPRPGFSCGGWTVEVDGGQLNLEGNGDTLDALRCLAQASWWRGDDDETPQRCHALSSAASRALKILDLLDTRVRGVECHVGDPASQNGEAQGRGKCLPLGRQR